MPLPVRLAIRPCSQSFTRKLQNYRLTLLLATLAASVPLAAQAPPAPATARFVVVLDAAHGGDDTGGPLKDASGSTRAEKAYTLTLSVRLRSLLAARGISVVTTRESDSTVAPARRAEIANHANAAACLSLHASQSGSGIHLYASSLAPAEPARLVPWKTAQAAAVTRSLALAGVLNSSLQHAGMTVTLGRTALPGLDSMTCPAVAVEVAPELVTGQPQPTALDDSAYQTRVAQALAAALLEWRTVATHTGSTPEEVQRP